MAFELTNVKRSLGKLITLLQTPPTWGGSAEFHTMSDALNRLWAESERLYTQNEHGEYPPLDQASLARIGAAYDAAVQALREYETSPVTGGAGEEQARDYMKQMRALLLKDQQMLGQVDPSKGVTLPQAAANAAALVVDIGTKETHYAGEHRLKAIPIQLQAPDGTTKTGYFQRLVVPDVNKNGAALFERMSAKYPAFHRLLDQLGSKPLTDAIDQAQGFFLRGLKEDTSLSALRSMVKNDAGQEAKAYLHQAFRKWMLLPMLGLPEKREHAANDPETQKLYDEANRLIAQMERDDAYLDFARELYDGLYEVYEDYGFYHAQRDNFVLPTGEAIEDRNAATRQFASLLGREDIMPASRSMVLIQNGVETRGIFIEQADGVSLDSLTTDHPFIQQFQKNDNGTEPTLSDFLTPQALKDVADIQVLMYLTSSVSVMTDNLTFKLREENGKLMVAGVTLKNNALSFGGLSKDIGTSNLAPSVFGMGVISEGMADRLRSMTREQLRAVLQGFGLGERELDVAWERTEGLKNQLAQDENFFDLSKPSAQRKKIEDAMEERKSIRQKMEQLKIEKENKTRPVEEIERENSQLRKRNTELNNIIGYVTGFDKTDTANGHIRVVKDSDWADFSLKKLKKNHGAALFGELENFGTSVQQIHNNQRNAVESEKRLDGLMRKAKGEPVGTIAMSEANREALIQEKNDGEALAFHEADLVTDIEVSPTDVNPVPAAVLGNGNQYSAQGARRNAETVRLFLPPDAKVSSVGGDVNQRHALSYMESGVEKKAFFTEATVVSFRQRYFSVFEDAIRKNPQYAHPLTQIRDYYKSNALDYGEDDIMSSQSRLPPDLVDNIPFEKMGIRAEQAQQLKDDSLFQQIWHDLRSVQLNNANSVYFNNLMNHIAPGSTVDRRNVAMYKVAETLGSRVIAKCTTAQVTRGDRIVDGVLMEAVNGVSEHTLKGSGLDQLTQEQRSRAMSDPRGLKSLAELQIMDFICLNRDRRQDNLLYQFEGLDTDSPKLVGVKGIDNDFSFLNRSLGTNDSPSEFFTSLEDITVIPKELAVKLQDPDAAAKIAEDLAACGLNREEIEKTKERISQLNDAIRDKKIEVVENWDGKTLDGLARLNEKKTNAFRRDTPINNIFSRARDAMVVAKNLDRIQPKKAEPLAFAAAQKIDDFGSAILRSDELDKEKRLAELKILDQVGSLVQNEPGLSGAATYVDAFRDARDRSAAMLATIKAADPALLWSSREFRDMRSACAELAGLSARLYRQASKAPGTAVPKAEVLKLLGGMDRLAKSAKAYSDFKENQCFAANREPNPKERARLAASKSMQSLSKSLRLGTLRAIDASAVSINGASRIDTIIQRTQKMAAQHSGAQLETSLAEVIYLKSLSRAAATGADKEKLAGLLTEEKLSDKVSEIRSSAAFKNLLSAESETSLRSLMNSERGGELFERFLQSDRTAGKQASGPEQRLSLS